MIIPIQHNHIGTGTQQIHKYLLCPGQSPNATCSSNEEGALSLEVGIQNARDATGSSCMRSSMVRSASRSVLLNPSDDIQYC